MLIAALIFDTLSFIPFVNIVSGFVGAIVMGLLGASTGLHLYSGKSIVLTLITIVIEEIPGFAMFPTWTIRVLIARKFEKTGPEEGLF